MPESTEKKTCSEGFIREMTVNDWDSVAAIYTEALQNGGATYETVCPDYEYWDEKHLSGYRYVFEKDGNVVGWSALSPYSHRKVYSGVADIGIYIAKEYAGRGIGKALIQRIVEDAFAGGFWTLQASIFSENMASLALFASCGFRTVGYRERIGMTHLGEWKDTVLLEKRKQD